MNFPIRALLVVALFGFIITQTNADVSFSSTFTAPELAHGSSSYSILGSFVDRMKDAIRGKVLGAPFIASNAVCPVSGASNLGGPCFAASCPGFSHNGDWVSKHGTDYGAPGGTPVYALVDGTIGGGNGCNEREPHPTSQGDTCGGPTWGWIVYLCGADGNTYFYVHITTPLVQAGQHVTKGQQIATIHPCGSSHLHIAIQDASQLTAWDNFFRCCTGSGGTCTQVGTKFCQNNQCVENGSSGIPCTDAAQCVPHERTKCSADRTQCLVETSIGQNECGAPPGNASLCQTPPPPPPPPPPGGGSGYSVCQNKKCIKVDGVGISQCAFDADCRTSHTTCQGRQCIVVPEPGKDECIVGSNNLIDFDGKCPLTAHKACVKQGLGSMCLTVPGPGADSCETDIDCAPASGPPLGPF